MSNEVTDIFVSNARNFLVEAQVLCEEASMRIVGAKGELSKWQQDVSKLRFMISCLKSQGDFLYKNVLKVGIGENLIKTEWSQVMLVDLIKTMKYWQDQISARVAQLNNINNVLVSGNDTNDDQLNLGDFIPKENTHILDERLKEIPIIKQQIENITSQYHNMTKKVGEQLIFTRIKTVEATFNKNLGSESLENKTLSIELPEEMDNLEHELVEYINSLTDHFDKCKLLQSKKLEGPSYQELLKVVTKDNGELGSILETLKDTIRDVDQVLENFKNLLERKTIDKVNLHSQINKLINEFHKHQEYLMIFKDISELISTFKESCLQEVKLTKELCEFYQNFKTSYYNLLDEVERRRSVAQEMTIVLQESQQKLHALHTQDQKAREGFLSENANYLPETIWPGKIDDLTPLYSLDYTIKDI
ncbi:hypothetical protein ZYGR_0H04190 [Zygosaccharomyces rouxii]|uniref:Autophagy-related protein 17 n=2 Tax=Zygosaccharomyces rouxii TaxID=4956 RepID=C5DS40_ZYGRC|nr:uncharacterized protein ZYRO0B13618g [Zygosaccharomyces rouxii]KAH9199870.1 autophagy-related protein 17 [Zygosaccharomyces rouxii]GAV47573.1 hypothetical protein ZYGR_0H04190 [Zygosaccharomyces rouxii]CAR26601.1 ZYRO0B13618p [Zygosaccharomyces rouxii]